MFTGIVREIGQVKTALERPGSTLLEIACSAEILGGLQDGDSVAVAGTCLTVLERTEGTFWVEMIPETLRRTRLADLEPGDPVNLEGALRLGDPLGGHLVLGHVDGVALVTGRHEDGESVRLDLAPPVPLLPLLPLKAFVTLDGVSLTVSEVDEGKGLFSVSLIPETLRRTTLGSCLPDTPVNLEVDPIARYVASVLKDRSGRPPLNRDGFPRLDDRDRMPEQASRNVPANATGREMTPE